MPLKILFTEATSLSARQTLYALAHSRSIVMPEIDVMDPAALSQCRFSSLVRRWYRCPHYAKQPQRFLDVLSERLDAGHYDVLLPTHEQTILLSRFRDELSHRVGLAVPCFESVATMQHKAHFMRLLTKLGLPIPETVFAMSRSEIDQAVFFPCFLKQAHSTAGAGVFALHSHSEYETLADRLESDGLINGTSEWLIQRPARGVMSTVKAVFDSGRMVAAAMYEARQQGLGGMSTARVSATHDDVFPQIAQIGRELNWHGGMFLDYFLDHETGGIEYLEGNPRIGETLNPTLGGVNLVERWVKVCLGEHLPEMGTTPASLPRFDPPVKTQSFYMILISKAYAGAGRFELLRELRDYCLSRGIYNQSEDELTRPREDPLSILPLIWILLQLLLWPGFAKNLVGGTIENYSLPDSALQEIQNLPEQAIS